MSAPVVAAAVLDRPCELLPEARGFRRDAPAASPLVILSVARLRLGEGAQRKTCFAFRRSAEVAAR